MLVYVCKAEDSRNKVCQLVSSSKKASIGSQCFPLRRRYPIDILALRIGFTRIEDSILDCPYALVWRRHRRLEFRDWNLNIDCAYSVGSCVSWKARDWGEA